MINGNDGEEEGKGGKGDGDKARVVGDEEGNSNGENLVRNNDNGLVPVLVQQAVLYSASTSFNDAGDNESTG